MEEKEIQDELASIRSLMERSSKFISLSGLSGILAGVYSLIGSGVAYWLMLNNPVTVSNHITPMEAFTNVLALGINFLIIAIAVLVMSVITAFILSSQKAKKNGQSIWGKATQILLFNVAIPLVTGGLFIFILLDQGYLSFVVPAMLIFYGLSLVSASNFTFTLVKYLGFCEIAIGLIAACLPRYALLFWAIGFGVLHIVYGSLMYFKYDR